VLSFEGEVLEETEIATSVSGYTRYFMRQDPALVAFEVGTHSAWIEEVVRGLGHDVIVANPHKLALISESNHKTDRRDAQTLAKLAALSPELLSPVTQRSPEMRMDMTVMHARDALVNERTALVNTVRGLVKPLGDRIPGTISTHAFHTKALEHIPPKLVAVLTPLLTVIGELTKQIDHYEREIEKLGKEKYPVTEHLREVAGVGPITSLAFVLCIMDPRRFKKSRDVGPYLGLVPRTYQSGESSPELRITKSGNTLVRRLLVGKRALHSGTLRAQPRQRSEALRFGPDGAGRQGRQETGGRGGGEETRGDPPPHVVDGGGLRPFEEHQATGVETHQLVKSRDVTPNCRARERSK
jgi:transposase